MIISPWQGRTPIPPFENESDNYIPVILVRRGDRQMLESAAVLTAAVRLSIPSRLPPPSGGKSSPLIKHFLQAPSPQPSIVGAPLITEKAARELGFTKEEIMSAFRRFTDEPITWKLVILTGMVETGGRDPFSAVLGETARTDVTFGIRWWSVARGTLQPILKTMREANPAQFDAIMAPDQRVVSDWLDKPATQALQLVQEEMLTGVRTLEISEPWKTRFTSIGSVPDFQRIQVAEMKPWVDATRKGSADLGLQSERGFAFVHDTFFQEGRLSLAPQKFAQELDGRSTWRRRASK